MKSPDKKEEESVRELKKDNIENSTGDGIPWSTKMKNLI